MGKTLDAAKAMQRYILKNLSDHPTAAEVAADAGYSLVHANRLFIEASGKSIAQYIRLLQLTHAADQVARPNSNILSVALEHDYSSHEGFTRGFRSAFGLTPSAYKKHGSPIPYLVPHPFDPETSLTRRFDMKQSELCTVTFVSQEQRKLIFLPSKKGLDYMSFCEEQGCDWEGLLLSIPARLCAPAYLTLPTALIPDGCCAGAVGIDVPLDYDEPLPKGYQTAILPAGTLAFFQTGSYHDPDEENFCEKIEAVYAAYENYQPAQFGYAFDDTAVPQYNFGAESAKGARLAVPVAKI